MWLHVRIYIYIYIYMIHDLISSLQSQFRVFYLDDGTLGGTLDEVSADLALIETQAPLLGLILNQAKSEVICANKDTISSILTSFPTLHPSDPRHAILLGSPIGGIEAIEDTIKAKVADLQRLGERLPLLEAHDSLCLLRSAFAIPKVLYILRTAPCFLSPSLDRFDSLQRSLIESICNIQLSDASWLQASLPINGGGLGIRSAAMLAPSAYLASAAGSAPISQAILPAGMTPSLPSIQAQALVKWGKWVDESVRPPIGVAATKQKTWDTLVVESCFSRLLNQQAANPRERARLQACSQKESGAWLTAPPISSLGLRMCNATIRIATSLRLGTHLCAPHDCTHCGRRVDETGLHGLSCRRSTGRLPRHNQLNTIIKQSLASANIPSVLEPQGLSCTDGKRPDGMTITPWAQGRLLIWDATCWDTMAATNIPIAMSGPGRVADMAARRKRETYREILHNHHFVPAPVETMGSFGEDTIAFLHQVASRIQAISKDPLEYLKLCQRFSVCIQNFNSASILGCCTLV